MISLLSRLRRQRPTRSQLEVTVLTRAQCCCCHKALDLLQGFQRTHGFTLNTRDIDADPALQARFDTEVPVVLVDGKVRFKGVVNPVLFERLLLAEASNPHSEG